MDTNSVLYRNATGNGRVFCASCHSSPHAIVPSRIQIDNYQALQYQGAPKTIGPWGACHDTSRGIVTIGEYTDEHGGSSPTVAKACNICHTSTRQIQINGLTLSSGNQHRELAVPGVTTKPQLIGI